MVRQVKVGFDGSAGAVAALAWAVREAQLHRARLVALAGLEASPLATIPRHAADGDGEDAWLASLRDAVQRLTKDYPAVIEHGRGDAAQVLMAACEADDLLVVGSRGRGGFAGLLLGSVSRACLKAAPCPVVVVREPQLATTPFGQVIVGLDASEHSRRALRVAAQEARARGAALQAIHVLRWNRLRAELIAPATHQLVGWVKDLIADELAGSGVEAQPAVLDGHPSDVLVQRSAHADLLVLGSRGHTQVGGMLLGSTSDYCTRHASCPVMVVR